MKNHVMITLLLLVGVVCMGQQASYSGAPDITEYTWVDSQPIPLNQEVVMNQVTYPHKALIQGIEGKVYVRVLVDEFGKYQTHKVTRNADPLLSQALAEQIQHLTFSPATRDEENLPYWTNLTFEFNITEALRKKNLRKRKPSIFAQKPQQHLNQVEYLNQGLAYMDQRSFDDAIIAFTRSILLNPKHKKRNLETRIQIHFNRAKAHMALGNWNQADADLTEVIGSIGISPHADTAQAAFQSHLYLNRGIVRLYLSRPVDALEDFNWLYAHLSSHLYNPNSPALEANLSKTTYEEALPLLVQLAVYNPENPVVDFLIGHFCRKISMNEASAKAYIAALDKTTNMNFTAFLYDNLGNTFLELEQYAEALTSAQEAIDLIPAHPLPYYNKAIALLKLNQRKAALPMLEHAMEIGLPTSQQITARNILQLKGKNDLVDLE